MFKFVQTCSNLSNLIQTCTNLSKLEKINSDQFVFDKCDQLWQFWIIWQFCSLSEFWTIVTVLNICDRLDHLWQFLPMKTSDKCDFIIVKIVINSENFDQFWLLWPIVTNYNCEQLKILWLVWPLVTNMSSSACHKCEQFWLLLGTSFETETI